MLLLLPFMALFMLRAAICTTSEVASSVTVATENDLANPSANFSIVELTALQDLYDATNGDNWSWKNESSGIHWNFTSDANPCLDRWQGITCDLPVPFETYHVSNLTLSNYSLHGSLPATIGNLTWLNVLQLSTNNLHGPVPEQIGTLPQLRLLDLSSNQFTGSVSAMLCSESLQHMLLGNNFLSGDVPCAGNPTGITTMILSNNRFSGTIPDEWGNNMDLEVLDAGRNLMAGTIPHTLGKLRSLRFLILNKNRVFGSLPESLANLTHLEYIDVSNNQLTGTLDASFNASVQSQLQQVVLHDNMLSGSLPESVLSNHNLQYLYLDNNCFTGSLSDSICSTSGLRVLSMGGLGSALACVVHPFGGISNSFVVLNAVHGQVPACVFELPQLTSLILVNNEFSGTIPYHAQLSKNLTQVILSYNRFSGSVPMTLQQARASLVDVSYNQFSGVLVDPGALDSYQERYCEYNLLSGHVPKVYEKLYYVSILEGNIFTCLLDKSDLISNDPHSINYQCGSDDYNVPYMIWLVACVGVIVAVYCVYSARNDAYFVGAKNAIIQAYVWVNCVRQLKLQSVHEVREVGKHLILVGCYCAVWLVVVGTPVYAVLTLYYGTYESQYAWTVSIVLLKGTLPFICGVMLWCTTLLIYSTTYRYNHTNLHSKSTQHARLTESSGRLETFAVCTIYLTVNIVVTTVANVYFVFNVIYLSSSLQIILSVYKVIWNSAVLPYLSRWMVYRLSARRADFYTFELGVALLCNVMIPIVVVMIVSPSCFYGVVVPNLVFSVETETDYLIRSLLYHIPFHYNYQCSFTYLEYYASAYIYLCIFSSFGIPFYELVALFFYKRAVPGTKWFYVLSRIVPRILKPLQTDPLAVPARDIFRPYFDATKYLIGQMTCLALILSIGVVSPPVAVSLATTMFATSVYTVLKVGRFVTNASAIGQVKYLELIEDESRNVVSAQMLSRSFWVMIVFTCTFITPFLFDVLGSAIGLQKSFYVLIVFPLTSLLLYSIVWLTRCIWRRGLHTAAATSAKQESTVELQFVVVSPDVVSPLAGTNDVVDS